ncbi:MAG: EcsC family protein [Myxococcaceae bacterium]
MQLDDIKRTLRSLGPASLKRLANQRLSTVVLNESRRAKQRVSELKARYPSAAPRELSQHLIEQKKQVAALVGGISGAFGVVGIPADLVAMAVLEIQLLVDIATAYEVRLEFARSREEMLEVLMTANGVGALGRASPKVVGKVAQVLFERGGLASFGRALPLVAAPVTSWLNNRDIQKLGDAALLHYQGFARAAAKRSS